MKKLTPKSDADRLSGTSLRVRKTASKTKAVRRRYRRRAQRNVSFEPKATMPDDVNFADFHAHTHLHPDADSAMAEAPHIIRNDPVQKAWDILFDMEERVYSGVFQAEALCALTGADQCERNTLMHYCFEVEDSVKRFRDDWRELFKLLNIARGGNAHA